MKTKHVLVALTALVAVPMASLAPATALDREQPAAPAAPQPAPVREVAPGTFLGVANPSLRLLRVENPNGAPGCEGAPRPDLRAVLAGGDADDLFDPAPDVALSAGGNTVLSRGSHVAISTFCEGSPGPVWLATARANALRDVRRLPDLAPRPTGQFLLTSVSGDGRRLLGVNTSGPGLEDHYVLAVDTATGAVRDLGVTGYWAGTLDDGALVLDQGDRVRIGDRAVTVPNPPGAGRFLAISPRGDRVAFGNETGLRVIERNGTSRPWSTDPVRGQVAWSPDGRTVAYVTGPADALTGELRVARAGSPPQAVAPSVVPYTPIGFAADRPAPALLATAPGADPTDPAGFRVIEVAAGRPGPAVPTSPATYAERAFEAWRTGNGPALARLADPAAVALLTDRPARPGEVWAGPSCEGAAGSTYCTWTTAGASLTLRVANEDAALGHDHAVIAARLGPPAGGIALWPLTTAAEAGATQEQVDQGHSPWMLEPTAVADSFARAELGWDAVEVTVTAPSTVRVRRPGAPTAVALTVGQPARQGPGGIWVVVRAESITP